MVIKALKNQHSHSGQYLLNAIHHAAEHLHAKQDGLIDSAKHCQILGEGNQWKGRSKGVIDLQVHWVLGHCNFGPKSEQLKKQN